MESVIVRPNEITEEDQKRRVFMNNSSIHSFNHTLKKDRIIRVTNAHIFRDGKVVLWLTSEEQIEKGDLWIRNGKILDSKGFFYSRMNMKEEMPDEVVFDLLFDEQVIDAKDCIVCPGFIDIQINGAYGIDFSDPNLTMEEVHKVTRNLLSVILL